MNNTFRFFMALVAILLAIYAAIHLDPVSDPLSFEEPGIDWTAVAALVASIAAGIEALFSSVTRLVAMFRKRETTDAS